MLIYLIIAGATMGAMHLLTLKRGAASPFLRTFTSSGAGVGSYYLLDAYTSTNDFLTLAYNGDLGIYGLVMISGLIALVSVWGWNLFHTRRHLVR